MYYHTLFILSKRRLLIYIVFVIYIYVLELLLAVIGILRKNDLVILSIIRGTIKLEGIKELITRLIMEPRIRPVMGLATKSENIKEFSIGPASRPVGVERLSLN